MTIKAHFDGKVLVPDEPLELDKGQAVELKIKPLGADEKKCMTAGELAKSDIVGMWEDRKDINDSTEFVNEIRTRIGRREL